MDVSDEGLVLNENVYSDNDMDSDPDFISTDESAVPCDEENEHSIGDFVGPCEDEGMSSEHKFVDISSNNGNLQITMKWKSPLGLYCG